MESDYPTLDRVVTAYESFQAFEERCYTLLHAIVDLPRPQHDFNTWTASSSVLASIEEIGSE